MTEEKAAQWLDRELNRSMVILLSGWVPPADLAGTVGCYICEAVTGNCPCKPHGSPDETYAQVPGTDCHKAVACASVVLKEWKA